MKTDTGILHINGKDVPLSYGLYTGTVKQAHSKAARLLKKISEHTQARIHLPFVRHATYSDNNLTLYLVPACGETEDILCAREYDDHSVTILDRTWDAPYYIIRNEYYC